MGLQREVHGLGEDKDGAILPGEELAQLLPRQGVAFLGRDEFKDARIANTLAHGGYQRRLAEDLAARAAGIAATVEEIAELVGDAADRAARVLRERVRALGPTNHPHHGKQAEGGAAIEALQHASGAARSKGRVNLIKR